MNELVAAVPWLGKRNPTAARWLIIIIAIAAPFIAWQFGRSWVRILDFALLYMMLALGLNLVVGFAGLLDLGYIAFYAVGAYTFALLASPHFGIHLPFWLILPLGAAFAALAGIMLGFPVLRLRGDYLAIVTLGFGEIVRIFMLNLNYPVNITNGPQGINMIDPINLFGWDLSRNLQITENFSINSLFLYYYFFLLCVAGSILFVQRLQISRIGRAWAAMRDDELAAAACGIDTDAAKMQAFVVGGALSGLAGGLYAHWIGFISPEQFGLVFSFELLMLAFIGGARRIAGAAWGALVIVAIPPLISLLRDRLPGDWARASGLELLLFGAVIVGVVLLRPAGLAGGGQGKER
jgi:branched-chain amino acid transport system permease protein